VGGGAGVGGIDGVASGAGFGFAAEAGAGIATKTAATTSATSIPTIPGLGCRRPVEPAPGILFGMKAMSVPPLTNGYEPVVEDGVRT